MASGRTLRRRWILTSFLFLLTLVAALAAWVKLPGPYQAESMIVLYPSQQASKVNGDNPLMSFGGSLNVAGDIVLRQVSAPTSVAALAARGYSSSFTIADDPNTTGPILDITVTGSSQSQVENTLRGVTTAVTNQLTTLQQNYKPANRITSQVVSDQPTAKLLLSKKARTIVIILGLGLVLTFALPQIVDAEIGRRRGRRATTKLSSGTPQYAGAQAMAEPERAGHQQRDYHATAAAPAERAPRYGGPPQADYASPRAEQYQADPSGGPAAERRYGGPPPAGRRGREGEPDQEYPQRRRSEGTRI
ncbi:MAG: hypothetical protein ACRDMI_08340 [Streptosporangiaceae bacterium]